MPLEVTTWRLALCAATALATEPARAHGLDADRLELVLRGDAVEAVATPSVDAVRWADVDRDGRLTRAELDPRREAVRDALVAALRITDDAGREGTVERADVSLPHGHDDDDSAGRPFLRVTVVRRWTSPLAAVRVRCDFARARPVTVYATRAEAGSPGVLTLVGVPELARLASSEATVTLLRRAAPAPPAAPASTSPPAPSRAPWLWLAAMFAAAFTLSLVRSRRPARGDAP